MVVLNLQELKAIIKLMELGGIEQTIGNMLNLFASHDLRIIGNLARLRVGNKYYGVHVDGLQEVQTDGNEDCYKENCPFFERGYCNLLHGYKIQIEEGACYADYNAYAEQNDPYSGVAYEGSF